MELQRLIHSFIHYLRAQRRLAANTQESYLLDLMDMAEYCKGHGAQTVPDLSRNLLRAYLGRLKDEKKVSAATLARRVSSIRGWLKYLQSRENIDTSHLGGARFGRGMKRKRPMPRALSETQVTHLLTCALREVERADTAKRRFTALRCLTMLELLYSSGLRVSELCSLPEAAVDWRGGLMRIMGKGSKERIVPMGAQAQQLLLNYRAELHRLIQNAEIQPSAYLFCNRWGRPLSRVTVEMDVRKVAKIAGLELTPHGMRHSFATHMLIRGLDLRNLQEMLGHKSLEATQVYTSLTPAALQKTYERTHPRA